MCALSVACQMRSPERGETGPLPHGFGFVLVSVCSNPKRAMLETQTLNFYIRNCLRTHIYNCLRRTQSGAAKHRGSIGSGDAATRGTCNIRDGMGMAMAVAIGICASTCCGAASTGCNGFFPLDFRGLFCFGGITSLPPLLAFMSRFVNAPAPPQRPRPC